jgi:hypothetical protein
MEKEPPAEIYRVMRAVRSLNYNRDLEPVIAGRIERAEAKIRSFMLVNNLNSTRIGVFQINLDEENEISLARLAIDDWHQLSLPRVSALEAAAEILDEPGHPPELVTEGGNGQTKESPLFSVAMTENY